MDRNNNKPEFYLKCPNGWTATIRTEIPEWEKTVVRVWLENGGQSEAEAMCLIALMS